MPFHPMPSLDLSKNGFAALQNSVSCRSVARSVGSCIDRRTLLTISCDLVAYLRMTSGEYIRAFIGSGEDEGSFTLERASGPLTGYKLVKRGNGARSFHAQFLTKRFIEVQPFNERVNFIVEKQDGILICRPPRKLEAALTPPLRAVGA